MKYDEYARSTSRGDNKNNIASKVSSDEAAGTNKDERRNKSHIP